MRDSFICPCYGGFMEFDSSNGSSICDTCNYIIRYDGSEDFSEIEPETEEIRVHNFLVQKHIEGKVYVRIYTETQLISYLNMADCNDEEYRIYDISVFGEVKEVFYRGWQPNCLIEVADSNGNIVISGYGIDH